MNPMAIAAFYRDLFDLKEEEKALEDPNFYLTDGKVTLIIAPWKMSDFEGAGIDRPGIEHIGFKVESIEAVKKELAALRESDPEMRERIVSEPKEGERRLALIATCRHGQHQFSDPDGVFVDISEELESAILTCSGATVSAQSQLERGGDDGLGPVGCVLEAARIENFSAF